MRILRFVHGKFHYRDAMLILIAFSLGTIYAGLGKWNTADKRGTNDGLPSRANGGNGEANVDEIGPNSNNTKAELLATCVALRLEEAELNWRRNSKKIIRNEGLIVKGSFPNQAAFDPLVNGTVVWDYFVPSFSCPFTTERLGRVGDGGKWVCGIQEIAKNPNCVVYSFGVHGETSFEEEILNRTSCQVHMFDPASSAKLPVLSRFPERATFSNLGIGSADGNGFGTLKKLMEQNGDSFADILKIDVEGAEWGTLTEILSTFPDQLPFSQLQLEVHLHNHDKESQYERLRSVWTALQQAGLRLFHDEPNLLKAMGIYLFHEFSFLNTNSTKSPFYISHLTTNED